MPYLLIVWTAAGRGGPVLRGLRGAAGGRAASGANAPATLSAPERGRPDD